MRISVIMGIYNCAPTLSEALDSLIAQTYQDFKVIMCDDRSTDNTIEVAQKYVDKYPGKFILIKNERNLKLAATLNHCLRFVDTEYVARMDGDDISLPERFEKEIKFLNEHAEYALVSCPMIYFDENGDYRVGKACGEPPLSAFNQSPFCHAPVMMRFEALKAIGFYTAESRVERIEDYYLWYKFYKAGYKGYNIPNALYKMRNDKNAYSRRKFKDRWRTYLITIEVKRNLNIPYPYLSGIPGLLKAFVPSVLVQCVKRLIY